MKYRQLFATFLFLLFLILVSNFSKGVVLDGVNKTSLRTTSSNITGSVSQSLVTPQSKGILPAVGKNFKVLRATYFNNKQWVVVVVSGIPDNDNAVLILQELNGVYRVVLGPGTLFPSSSVQSMPLDVVNYLVNQGLVSNASPAS
jgi:hypothetical protein